jgi:hypothetical protein
VTCFCADGRYFETLLYSTNPIFNRTLNATSRRVKIWFLSWGRHALEPLDLLFGVDPDPVMSREHWLDRLKKARELAAQANEAANRKMKERSDQGKEPHRFQVGDPVWVKEKRVPPGLTSKLRAKAADVEYRVKDLVGGGGKHAQVESIANSLDQRKVHVDRLKKVVPEPEGIFGEVPVDAPTLGPGEYEVERILGHRSASSGRGVEYFVRWKGYGADEDRWVPAVDIKAEECVAKYEREKLMKQDRVAESTMLTYAEVAKKAPVEVAPIQGKSSIQPSRQSERKRVKPKGAPRSR